VAYIAVATAIVFFIIGAARTPTKLLQVRARVCVCSPGMAAEAAYPLPTPTPPPPPLSAYPLPRLHPSPPPLSASLPCPQVFINAFIVVIVANVPEGLPATVVSCLTITAKRMKGRNVFIKDMQVRSLECGGLQQEGWGLSAGGSRTEG